MQVRICLAVIFGLGLAAAGCRDQENPVPELNEGLSPVAGGNRLLLPTMAPPMKDRASILGAAASAEEVGSGKAAAAEAAANVVKIQIDDTTAENLMKGFVAIIEAGSFAQLPDIVVPEQQEAAKQLAGVMGPLFHGLKAVETKWKEKFPDTPMPAGFQGPGLDAMRPPKVTEVKVQDNGTEAEAIIENPQGGEPEKIQLKKIDDAWRISDAKLKMEGDPETVKKFMGAFSALGKAMQDFAVRLDNDEFASAADAEKVLAEVGQKTMGAIMGELMAKMGDAMKDVASQPAGAEPPGAKDAPPSPETLQPAPPAKPKKPPFATKPNAPEPANESKPKSELEQGVDNAAGRSAMGGI